MVSDSYLQSYLDRDLRELFGVEKIAEFHMFLRLCAARTGQILNMSELARDAGVSVHAVREWLSILESTLHVFLLRPYFRNVSQQLIKAPKLYFLDTGLAAFLTKWSTPDVLAAGAMAGAFFETHVVGEIVKSYLFRGIEPPLFYYRDKLGREVDLLIEENQVLHPVEIKRAARVTPEDARTIEYLRTRLPQMGTGAVVCLAREPPPLTRDVAVIPVSAIQ